MLYFTTEFVNLDLKWNGIFLDIYLPLPGCVARPQNELWKNGADEAAADRSQGSHSVGKKNHVMVISVIHFHWLQPV